MKSKWPNLSSARRPRKNDGACNKIQGDQSHREPQRGSERLPATRCRTKDRLSSHPKSFRITHLQSGDLPPLQEASLGKKKLEKSAPSAKICWKYFHQHLESGVMKSRTGFRMFIVGGVFLLALLNFTFLSTPSTIVTEPEYLVSKKDQNTEYSESSKESIEDDFSPMLIDTETSESISRTAVGKVLQGTESVPENEQQSLWRAFSKARHEIRPLTEHQKSMTENDGAIFLASNPGQNLRARFIKNGLKVLSGDSNRNWSGIIGLATEESDPEILHEDGFLRYRYENGITEWFENRPEGIEHGFVVESAPSEGEDSRLIVPVRLEGLRANYREEPESLQFSTEEGEAVLEYKKLKVWDANGDELLASMTPTRGGLEIAVETAEARFPIVIDPLIVSLETRLSPEITGTGAGDFFGASISISGERAAIGAPHDDDDGDNSGSAYVFVREEGSWSLESRLVSRTAAEGDFFGSQIGISGETIVIGSPGYESGQSRIEIFERRDEIWRMRKAFMSEVSSVAIHSEVLIVGSDGGYSNSGFVDVYNKRGSRWSLNSRLEISSPPGRSDFGESISLSETMIVVGDAGNPLFEAVYVFELDSGSWRQSAKLISPEGLTDTEFGGSVSVSGDSIVIGARVASSPGSNESGRAYVYKKEGDTWNNGEVLVPETISASAYFGAAVAISGDTIVVGAYGEEVRRGAAYIFRKQVNGWTQAKRVPNETILRGWFGSELAMSSDTILIGSLGVEVFEDSEDGWLWQTSLSDGESAARDAFGASVSINGDSAVVGAIGDDDNGSGSGSAYVFKRTEGIWEQDGKLVASNGAAGDAFGSEVSICDEYIAVSAPRQDGARSDSGSVFLFERIGEDWLEVAKLTAESDSNISIFGNSLSLGEGWLSVGARTDSREFPSGGSVYLYQHEEAGWTMKQRIVADDANAYYRFGTSVSLSGDLLLVGSDFGNLIGDNIDFGPRTGSAYVFSNTAGLWRQEAVIIPSDAADDDYFGTSVCLDGERALIGAPGDDGSAVDSGSAYLFERSDGEWLQVKKFEPSDGEFRDQVGTSVGLSGQRIAIGALAANGSELGFVSIFEELGGDWIETQKLRPVGQVTSDYFGEVVSISGDSLLVGSRFHDGLDALGGPAINQGAAYIYNLESNSPPSLPSYSISTVKDRLATLALDKVLSAAFDPEGDFILVADVNTNSDRGGMLVLHDTYLTYSPPFGYTGTDSFEITLTDEHGASSLGVVSVLVRPSSDGPGVGGEGSITVRNPARIEFTDEGRLNVRFLGIPGREYRIERSTDMQIWATIAVVTSATNGEILYHDPSPPSPDAFYRLAN